MKNDSNSAAIGSGGGIEAVVAGMQSHGGSAAVQEWGCRALSNLSVKNDSIRAAIGSGGSIEAVVAAMQSHGGSAAVQEWGCVALSRLSMKNDSIRLVPVIEGRGSKQAAREKRNIHRNSKGIGIKGIQTIRSGGPTTRPAMSRCRATCCTDFKNYARDMKSIALSLKHHHFILSSTSAPL